MYAFIASSTASFNVFEPLLTGMMLAPNMRILSTFGFSFAISTSPMYISHSSPKIVAAVAVATPC